jgi:hypothetical protein
MGEPASKENRGDGRCCRQPDSDVAVSNGEIDPDNTLIRKAVFPYQ